MKAIIRMQRLGENRDVLEEREFLSKSFVRGFIQGLYTNFSQLNHNVTDIRGSGRTVYGEPTTTAYLGRAYSKFRLSAPAGLGEVLSPTAISISAPSTYRERAFQGHYVGIQVGDSSTAVAITNSRLLSRIIHGRGTSANPPATFTNNSFETGDFTGWTVATNGSMAVTNSNVAWALKDGNRLARMLNTATVYEGDYGQISQDIDLTDITHIRLQLRCEGADSRYGLLVFIDDECVYIFRTTADTDYANEWLNVTRFTGVHTVTFRTLVYSTATVTGRGHYIDNIETFNVKMLEYGGCDVLLPVIADPNGEFTITRDFLNLNTDDIEINECGLYCPLYINIHCIARDLVVPSIVVAPNELLRVEYTIQITV